MNPDNGKRLRWSDSDHERADETAEDRSMRHHARDIDNLAHLHMDKGMPVEEGRFQRAEEDAGKIQDEVRNRITEIEESFSFENPKFDTFRAQFDQIGSRGRNARAWYEVLDAIQRGGQFSSAREFFDAIKEFAGAEIIGIKKGELIIREIAVPSSTLGMNYEEARRYCDEQGLAIAGSHDLRNPLLVQREDSSRNFSYHSTTEEGLPIHAWWRTSQKELDREERCAYSSAGNPGLDNCFRLEDATIGRANRGVLRELSVKLEFNDPTITITHSDGAKKELTWEEAVALGL